jgi:hypothetical protein
MVWTTAQLKFTSPIDATNCAWSMLPSDLMAIRGGRIDAGQADRGEFRPNYSAITQCARRIRQACGVMLPRLVGLSDAVIQDRESVVSHAHDVISQ